MELIFVLLGVALIAFFNFRANSKGRMENFRKHLAPRVATVEDVIIFQRVKSKKNVKRFAQLLIRDDETGTLYFTAGKDCKAFFTWSHVENQGKRQSFLLSATGEAKTIGDKIYFYMESTHRDFDFKEGVITLDGVDYSFGGVYSGQSSTLELGDRYFSEGNLDLSQMLNIAFNFSGFLEFEEPKEAPIENKILPNDENSRRMTEVNLKEKMHDWF